MWDQHLHSHFSADCESRLDDIVNAAKSKGLSGLCFTDHLDLDYPKMPDELDFLIDWENYFKDLEELKANSNDLPIRIGVELGLQNTPSVLSGNAEIVKSHPFDFVIGSLHVIDGEDPYYGRYFAGRTKKEAYEQYFSCTLANIKAFTDFDVLGHIDYMIRYYPGLTPDGSPDRLYSYADYADLLDEILKTLIESGRGIEINSAGIRKGAGTLHPQVEVIRRYHELGGEILTIGSDAHIADDVGADFAFVADLAKDCGFKYYTLFQKRKAEFLPL